MECLRHPVQAFLRIDHQCFRRLEGVFWLQLPRETARINAQPNADLAVLVHFDQLFVVAAVDQAEADCGAFVFGAVRIGKRHERILLVAARAAFAVENLDAFCDRFAHQATFLSPGTVQMQ
ncbi:hypothetical protein SDC9_171685 [bioreactor metagenome]|uniref:Uncharacterized protein n=1 Tax=bioreactor metagenome TaxID=1076179 RepID=A0A645GDX9_9ZZZZ